jgi:Sec-independent protein secretion pathway component TatC
MFLYEISIFVARFAAKKKVNSENKEQ